MQFQIWFVALEIWQNNYCFGLLLVKILKLKKIYHKVCWHECISKYLTYQAADSNEQ